MSAAPGWYPDPGGQPGLFRYWDGRSWSPTTTNNPYGGSPATAPPGTPYGGPSATTPTRSAPAAAPGAQAFGTGRPAVAPRRRSPVGWILAAVAAVVVVVVVAVIAVQALRGSGGPIVGEPPVEPSPGGITCPATPSRTPSAVPDTGEQRVVSGHLSYPRLPAPFSAPQPDSRTPFGRDVRSQTAEVEKNSDGRSSWVAAVLIARLLAGDGFYGPQQGAEVVATCVIGKFYGDNPVEREDKRNEATTVDGHDAWIIDMHLTFDIPGIQTKGERATIVVVDTGSTDGEAGLYYSSVPDTSPQFAQPAAEALKDLQVS